jgi:predicted dehydrogenase
MKLTSSKTSVCIVGFGYWGKILVRIMIGIPGVRIVSIVDPGMHVISVDMRGRRIPVLRDMDTALKDTGVDAVMISSPAGSHFSIAKEVLLHNKHVFIEKPMTLSVADAETLTMLARKNKRVLLVDHTYIYSDAVVQMKRIMDHGDIGTVYAMESVRMNRGTQRADCSVVWDLAVHDIAIYRYFFGSPASVRVTGFQYGGESIVNRATVYLENNNGISGIFDVSWVYPKKIRRLVLIGTKGCLVMDDMGKKGKISLYQDGRIKRIIDSDDVRKEPLRRACEDFISCIRTGVTPRVSGSDGVAVISVLEAAQRSLTGGKEWEAT